MAGKAGLQDILLKKGEKFALIVGAVVAGLLLVLGVKTMASVNSPTTTVKEFKDNASRIKSGLQQAGEEAPPLPEWAQQTPKKATEINADKFALAGNPFEPVSTPDLLRHNPKVLGIIDWEMGYVHGPMKALDIQENGNGPPSIGVLVTAAKGDIKLSELSTLVTDVMKNRLISGQQRPKKPQPKRPGFGFPPPPQPIGGSPLAGPPGAGAPGAGFPGGGGAGGPPPGAMASMMPPGGADMGSGTDMYGGGMAMFGDPTMLTGSRAGIDKTVRYLTPDEVKKSGYPLAETVYPMRMVLVQAAYPLKLQIEEIKQALRIVDPTRAGMAAAGAPPGAAAYPGAPGGPMPPGSFPMTPAGFPMSPSAGTPPMMPGAGAAVTNINPYFYGFEVERLVIPPGGKMPAPDDKWTGVPFDHEEEYFRKIRARKVADLADSPELYPFLRYDQRLAAPLPMLADKLAEYPRTTMKPIVDTIEKIRTAMTPKEVEDAWKKRFQNSAGSDNPYAPFAQSQFTAGGPMGGSDPSMPLGGMPPDGPPPGGMPPGGLPEGAFVPYPGAEGAPGFNANGQMAAMPEIEHLLLRFVDPSVQPGYRYMYRLRVVMHNPNYVQGTEDEKIRQKHQLDKVLRRPTDASIQKLYGPWVKIPQIITIPPESFLYAFDTQEYLDRVDALVNQYGGESALKRLAEEREVKAGQKAVIQFQTWMPQVRIDGSGKTEPVGSWVVSEVPVARGEFIGKRQLVELPLWSAALKNYVLREMAAGVKVAGIKDQNNQPKGWPINFKTSSVLVDFDGGPTRATVRQSGRDRDVEDTSETEVLILLRDGKMLVRSSAKDAANEDRTARDTGWKDWVKRAKDRKDMTGLPTDPMGAGFDRNRPGSP